MRHAPSRMEYSEWTWRWTKGAVAGTARPRYKSVPTGPFGPAGMVGLGLVVVVAAADAAGREEAQVHVCVGAGDGAEDGRALLLQERARPVRGRTEEGVLRRAVAR